MFNGARRRALTHLGRLLLSLSLAAVLPSCGKGIDPAQLVGTWTFYRELGSAEAAKYGGAPLPAGAELSMKLSGTETFQANGGYRFETTIDMRIDMAGRETEMRFLTIEEGRWTLDDDLLVQTNTATDVKPGNALTEKIMAQDDSLRQAMLSQQGETARARILAIDETKMVLEDEEHGIRLELFRG